MSNTIKLTEEELKKINDFQTKYSTVSAQMGQLKIEQIILSTQSEKLKELESEFTKNFLTIQAEEDAFAKEITAKYGDGNINLETGEFNKV